MDQAQCNTLWSFLGKVPDPRAARGQRYAWMGLLTLVLYGLASGQKTVWAIACWVQQHIVEIQGQLALTLPRAPSAATFYRALRRMPIEELEQQMGAYGGSVEGQREPEGEGEVEPRRSARAVDGKELRGTLAQGELVHLVSMVEHDSGATVRQCRVPQEAGELAVMPQLLSEESVQGQVITFDALYAQRSVAQRVIDLGGDYLVKVKGNQPHLLGALQGLFSAPPAPGEERWECTTYDKGHGRWERRHVVASEGLQGRLEWPGMEQVLCRTCERVQLKSGTRSLKVRYAVTSLPHEQASVEELAALWRGHWSIENRSHYVRDETLGEDRGQMHCGQAPQALAALRNGLLTALREHGWKSIPDALRAHVAPTITPLLLIGAPTRSQQIPSAQMQDSSTSPGL
jgi:predicted transposase YbfD/YdcC